MGLGYIGIGLGAGLCLIGAGVGIGLLAAASLQGVARQPEAAGSLFTQMIIPAAMIEGLGFFGLVIVLLAALALNKGVASATAQAPAQAESPAR
ncbi:MAG: ATP synthase F0 subunit C [Elusimicrobiota bacterium]